LRIHNISIYVVFSQHCLSPSVARIFSGGQSVLHVYLGDTMFDNENSYMAKLGRFAARFLLGATTFKFAAGFFARGFIWSVVSSLLLSLVFVPYLILTDTVANIPSAIRIANILSLGALGGTADFANFSPIGLTTTLVTTSVGVHVGLVTLVILLLSRNLGKKLGEAHIANSKVSGSLVIYLGLGFAAASQLIGLLNQGAIYTKWGSVNVEAPSIAAFVGIVALVSLAAYSGFSLAQSRSSRRGNFFAFVTKTLGYFSAIYSVLIGIAAAVWFVYRVIQPDFSMAHHAPDNGSSQPDANTIFTGLLALVFLLPNVCMQVLAFATGASVGVDASGSGAQAIESYTLSAGVPNSLFSSSSILVNWGFWAYLAVLVLVTVVALIAGNAAARKVRYQAGSAVAFASVIALTALTVWFAFVLAGWQVSTSSKLDETNTLQFNGFAGATVVTGLFVGMFIALASAWASHGGRSFVGSAFRGLIETTSGEEIEEETSVAGRIFGLVITIAVIVSAAWPVVAATTNRLMASTTDSPFQVASDVVSKLQTMKMADLKALYEADGKDVVRDWLPEQVLEAGRLSTQASWLTTEVKNGLVSLGQLEI